MRGRYSCSLLAVIRSFLDERAVNREGESAGTVESVAANFGEHADLVAMLFA